MGWVNEGMEIGDVDDRIGIVERQIATTNVGWQPGDVKELDGARSSNGSVVGRGPSQRSSNRYGSHSGRSRDVGMAGGEDVVEAMANKGWREVKSAGLEGERERRNVLVDTKLKCLFKFGSVSNPEF